jgi:hypothetical protein
VFWQQWEAVRKVGFVAEEEKGIFIEEVTTPLYDAYFDTLLQSGNNLDDYEIKEIVFNMNSCLNHTCRVGVTDTSNVLDGITSVMDALKKKSTDESELALLYCETFRGKVAEILA